MHKHTIDFFPFCKSFFLSAQKNGYPSATVLKLYIIPSLFFSPLHCLGVFLLSRNCIAVPSAPRSLTSVFGMGTGGPPVLKTPRQWIGKRVKDRFVFPSFALPNRYLSGFRFVFPHFLEKREFFRSFVVYRKHMIGRGPKKE